MRKEMKGLRMQLEDLIVLKIDFEYVYKINGTNNSKILHFYAINLCDNYKLQFDVEIDYDICYTLEKIIFFRRIHMKGNFCVEIPYGTRMQYASFISEMNTLTDADGMVILAVNNNPYMLVSYLLVESNTNVEKMVALIKKYELRSRQDKGITEIIREMGNRMWNTITIPQRAGLEEIQMYMQVYYEVAERDVLEEKDYFHEFWKAKSFISYSHKGMEIVMDIYQKIQISGMNCWLDLYNIDVGEPIVKKMMEGLKECDYGIFFLSKHYKDSVMAKGELHNFLADVFGNKKKWYLVKLDDVDVEEILPGLNHYKYYDFSENSDIEKLVMDMVRVLEGDKI